MPIIIPDMEQAKPASRRKSALPYDGWFLQQLPQASWWFLGPPDRYQQGCDAPHHVVEKGIGLDLEIKPFSRLPPACFHDRAAGMPAVYRCGSECAEVMLTQQVKRAAPHAIQVRQAVQPPGETLAQRVAQRIHQDRVAVAAAPGRETRVETRPGGFGLPHGDICRQVGVQGTRQILRAVTPIELEGDDLAGGMHTAIRSSGGEQALSLPADPDQG